MGAIEEVVPEVCSTLALFFNWLAIRQLPSALAGYICIHVLSTHVNRYTYAVITYVYLGCALNDGTY